MSIGSDQPTIADRVYRVFNEKYPDRRIDDPYFGPGFGVPNLVSLRDNLGFDEADFVDLAGFLSDEFSVRIRAGDLENLVTIQDVAVYVDQRVRERKST